MATVFKQDSNITGLRYADEASIKVLIGSPIWYPIEPNTITNFGGTITTVARNPINAGRQRKKGMVTDLAAAVDIQVDLTQTNLERLLPGFFFAAYRTKGELAVPTVVNSTNDYQPASGGAVWKAGDILFAKNFSIAANNGMKNVTGTPTGTSIVVAETLADESTSAGIISKVGFKFGSAEVTITNSGSAFPVLTRVSGSKDLTTLGLVPGEWVWIGGDASSDRFANAANTGFARVYSVTATVITFDKTMATFVTDAGTGKTVRLYFGRVLKNEIGSLIVRKPVQYELSLGAPDDSQPSQIQGEYVLGAIPNQITFNIPTAAKVTADLTYVAADSTTVDGATGLKSGTRPALVDSDAFNTSSDVTRLRLSQISATDGYPTSLFAFIETMTIVINNNIIPNKAVGVLGAFDMTAGTFDVSGSITAYFADVAAVAAIKANANISLDAHLVKNNTGISIDIPLVTLGDGRPKVEQDKAITLPLTMTAAQGTPINSSITHSALVVFFDYLPNLAS